MASSSSVAFDKSLLGVQERLNKEAIVGILIGKTIEDAYEEILPLTGPAATNPSTENRTCRQPGSKLHRLKCLHIVYTSQPTQCAPNCMTGKNGETPATSLRYPNFGCHLCRRIELSSDPSLKNTRNWIDVLLEQHVKVSSKDSYFANFRSSEIAYLAEDGTIIPIRTNLDAAIVRILWTRRDSANKFVQLTQRPDVVDHLREAVVAIKDPSVGDTTGFYKDVAKGLKNPRSGRGSCSKPDLAGLIRSPPKGPQAQNTARGVGKWGNQNTVSRNERRARARRAAQVEQAAQTETVAGPAAESSKPEGEAGMGERGGLPYGDEGVEAKKYKEVAEKAMETEGGKVLEEGEIWEEADEEEDVLGEMTDLKLG